MPAFGAEDGSTVNTAQLMVPGPLPEKTLGDPTAPVTVVEYASMTCPHCARFHNETFAAFKTKYVDTGKVFFVFREFPLDDLALLAILGARCAPTDQFFPTVARLFREQPQWAFIDTPGPALVERLKQQGVTDEAFQKCIVDKDLIDGIISVEKRGQDTFGITGTPTFFFNGQKHTGELTIAQVDAILEPILSAPRLTPIPEASSPMSTAPGTSAREATSP